MFTFRKPRNLGSSFRYGGYHQQEALRSFKITFANVVLELTKDGIAIDGEFMRDFVREMRRAILAKRRKLNRRSIRYLYLGLRQFTKAAGLYETA